MINKSEHLEYIARRKKVLNQIVQERQAELDKLDKAEAELKAKTVEPAHRVAEFLHNKLCRWSHTDQCSWYDNTSWYDKYSTRGEYLKKARAMLALEPDEAKLKAILANL
jgi:hypothetical protein